MMRVLARDAGSGNGAGNYGGGGDADDEYNTFTGFRYNKVIPPPPPPPKPNNLSKVDGGEGREALSSSTDSPVSDSRPFITAAIPAHTPKPTKLTVVHRFFKRDSTREAMRAALIQRLKALSEMDPTVEVAREIADSLYILKLMGMSSQTLEDSRKTANRGAMLLEAAQMVAQGQRLARSALSPISKL